MMIFGATSNEVYSQIAPTRYAEDMVNMLIFLMELLQLITLIELFGFCTIHVRFCIEIVGFCSCT